MKNLCSGLGLLVLVLVMCLAAPDTELRTIPKSYSNKLNLPPQSAKNLRSDATNSLLMPFYTAVINWQTIATGGNRATSNHFGLQCTFGQIAAIRHKSTHFRMNSGFQLALAPVGLSCCMTPGDINEDGNVNIGDAVALQNYVLKGISIPECLTTADVNHDCSINVADVVFMVNYIFSKPNWRYPKCSGCI